MSDLERLKAALGVKKDKATVMTVKSEKNGKLRLEANGGVVIDDGNLEVGTRVVVISNKIQSVIAKTVIKIYGE